MKLLKALMNLAVGTAMVSIAIAPVFVKGQAVRAVLKTAETKFPELVNADIKGAPKLGPPSLIMAETEPVLTEGMGWAAPAFWDYNGDGKKDLLIGEFGTGAEVNREFGNYIRIYRNVGTDKNPKFRDDFHYAYLAGDEMLARLAVKDREHYPKYLVNYGTPISIPQFCCMSIKPQFADLNGDGYPDLYAGRYTPGEVYWFRGSKVGFLPGEKLKQHGDPSADKQSNNHPQDPNDWSYWAYSAVAFGEFSGNGLLDMIVGGHAGLRISKNTGTKTAPEFGIRQLLLQPNGKPVFGADEKFNHPLIPVVVDWDQDGVLDILTSSTYAYKGTAVVLFFKGVKVNNEYRFEKGVSLFSRQSNEKAIPGEWLSIYVTDWNNDGVNDLLIGTKVALLNGKLDDKINWSWTETDGKFESLSKLNPGYYSEEKKKEIEQKVAAAVKLESEIGRSELLKKQETPGQFGKYSMKKDLMLYYYGGNEDNITMIHQGRVYVMLGEKR
jgi:hypothetical protein